MATRSWGIGSMLCHGGRTPATVQLTGVVAVAHGELTLEVAIGVQGRPERVAALRDLVEGVEELWRVDFTGHVAASLLRVASALSRTELPEHRAGGSWERKGGGHGGPGKE